MQPISGAQRSATAAGWAGASIHRRGEACDTCAATLPAPALGGTTLTEPHTVPRAFVCARVEKASPQTTYSTTSVHPTRDSFRRSGTAFVSHSASQRRSRTRQLSTRDPPNELRISRRERAAQDRVKKPPISRAKRSAALPGWAANGNLLY
jgi:hypothetical protein